jgi:hypothetical protein
MGRKSGMQRREHTGHETRRNHCEEPDMDVKILLQLILAIYDEGMDCIR